MAGPPNCTFTCKYSLTCICSCGCCVMMQHRNVCSMQVLGLFTVVATAVGCLYMMDTSMSFVASKSGLDAAGGLLLLLNTAFVLIMVLLLAQAGVADIKKGLLWVHKHFKSCWACFASPARASLRGTKPPIPLSTQMESPGTSCSASRANSTTALTQAVSTDSGDLMLVGRL